MKKYLVHGVWLFAAVIAFVGGLYYGKASASPAAGGHAALNETGAAGGRGNFGGNRAGGGFVAGTITAIDPQSITIELPNGNSEVVFYSASTSVVKPSLASTTDLAPGTSVMIAGTQNADGSLTAQSIQIRNANEPGFPGARSGQ